MGKVVVFLPCSELRNLIVFLFNCAFLVSPVEFGCRHDAKVSVWLVRVEDLDGRVFVLIGT